MSENTFTRQDKIYIVAFALQLTDEYINQPNFKDKKLITIDLPSGGALILAGNVQDELRKLRQYWKDFYEQSNKMLHRSMCLDPHSVTPCMTPLAGVIAEEVSGDASQSMTKRQATS